MHPDFLLTITNSMVRGFFVGAYQLFDRNGKTKSLLRLIEELQRLPGVGPKSAQRLAFHILRIPREQAERLVTAVRDVKERVTYCSVCNNITDADPCGYCRSDDRDRHTAIYKTSHLYELL